MTFENLETNLIINGNNREIDAYLALNRSLPDHYNSTFMHMLDIASLMNHAGLRDQYKIVGGYSVLAHLVNNFGYEIIPNWRNSLGSSDVDIIGTEKVYKTLKQTYNVKHDDDRQSPNLPNKRTIRIRDDERCLCKGCKVDFVIDRQEEIAQNSEEAYLLSVLVRVKDPISLIKDKVYIAQSQQVHREDVMGLLALLEKKGTDSGSLVRILEHNHRSHLHGLLEAIETSVKSLKNIIYPTKEYRNNLRLHLKKYLVK